MKKNILFLLALIASISLYAERVPVETARKVATTFLSNNGAKATQLTDLSKAAGFPNLYIFNAEEGFVVMAADDCVKPILGYSLTEKFVVEDMPENLVWWLQGYNDQIQDVTDNALPSDASAKTEWQKLKKGSFSKETNEIIVGPLISTLWDQTYPYNYYCPTCSSGGDGGHVYTGCVATAMAQVMKYWNYPTSGSGSHSYTHSTYGEQSVNFETTTYDWSHMSNSLSNGSSQESIDAVATLIYHCGVAVDMNYGTSSSGAYSDEVPAALINYFNYSPSTTYVSKDSYEDEQWIAFLKSELDEGRPLYYSGSNINSGHAFVCDGYRSDNYFHFNWGWSGYDGNYGSTHGNNGYWTIGALSPGSGGSGSGSGTYNLYNAVLAWAEPLSDLTAPTLSASIAEGVVTLSWNAVTNATYDIYRDNQKIASNVTNLSYVDNNVSFGHYYDYYIRAVSSEKKSNPSNFVTIANNYQDRTPQAPNAMIDVSDNSVNLTWTEPLSQSMDLHYGIGNQNSSFGSEDSNGTYWGQCYPSQANGAYAGMAIDRVSVFLGYSGSYSLYLYKNNVLSESNLLTSKNFTGAIGWNDIVLDNNIPLDITQDLWVVFHADKSIGYPAFFCEYFGNNKEHAHYLWRNFSENETYLFYTENVSWSIKIHLTDGSFKYNVYRDDALIAEQQSSNNYLDSNLSDGTHEYYIKTYANNWESAASNTVTISYTTEHHIANATTLPYDLTLSNYNRYIIEPTGSLTVTGTLSNNNPNNLILEDGAQLIHNSTGVKATIKKDIEPYVSSTDDGGWYFIASPVTENITPNTDNGLLNGTFDLYYYDEPTHYWKNYRHNSFPIAPKQGYLYATNATDNTLQFSGTLIPSNEDVTSNTLSWSANELKGFNLVGNPFACNADVNSDFYIISDVTHQVVLAEAGRTIAPCEGVFVKASAANQTVTFSKDIGNKEINDVSLDLIVANEKTILGRIRMRTGEGTNIESICIQRTKNNNFSFHQNGQDYSVIFATEPRTLPVQFKAVQDGFYTLSVESNRLDLDYLHLIDHLTGADIDLLVTPSYTFEAKTDDYTSRFKLVFSEEALDHHSNDIDFVDGKTQILDMTGRVVATSPNTKLAPGIYLLRTVNGNDIKTEKIIIK